MPEITRGLVQRKVGLLQEYVHHFGEGAIATDGVQYATAVTVGTTGKVVLNEVLDPGFLMKLDEVEVGLTFKTTHLGSTAGSLIFYWKAKSDYRTVGWFDGGGATGTIRTANYVMLSSGTMGSSVGSAVNNSYEHTMSGRIPVASLPTTPIRIQLIAENTVNQFTASVKNSSFVRLKGQPIPGA